jgi:2-(1,2-epoxy-1,2-dihydrophenyl)acetyl-CoA isomerase
VRTPVTEPPMIRLERDGSRAEIILARADRGNAVNLRFSRELRAAAAECAADASVRAVLVRAEGPAFCVGGDLAEFEAIGAARSDYLKALAPEFHAAQSIPMTMRAPVVVAVQGPAAGAGLGLALIGDIVIAATSAHFTVAYTAIGLSADGGSSHLLPRLIGLRRTQELMFTNRRLSAEEAQAWGLITKVAPDSDLRPQAESICRTLAEGPTEAHGVIKGLLATTCQHEFAAQTDLEARHIVRLAGGADAAEGIGAFGAKRRPLFKG